MYSSLKSEKVEVEGLGEVTVASMSARCWSEWQDARAEENDDLKAAAVVARYCVKEFESASVDEILDNHTPNVLASILNEVLRLSGVGSKNSEAGPVAASSAA